MKPTASDFIREQINAAIPGKFKNLTEFAATARVNQGTFSEFVKGRRQGLNLETAWKVFDALGLELGQKAGSTVRHLGAHAPKIVASEGDKLVDVYSVVGAGPGWEIVEVEPIKSIRVPLSFSAQSSFAAVVDGDSMSPTLQRGSVVGILVDAPFTSNEIYAVRPPDEGVSIKRVIRDHQRDGYVLRSDNEDKSRYGDVFIPAAGSHGYITVRPHSRKASTTGVICPSES